MNDTVRALLSAGALSAVAISTLAWTVFHLDPDRAERLVGELRLAQWTAVLLATVGAIPIGLTLAGPPAAGANFDLAFGVIFVGLAGIVLQRDPREGLLWLAGAFVCHALVDLAHRPGMLPTLSTPRYSAGCAVYNVYVAGLCAWVRHR